MLNNEAFHQGLHLLLRKNKQSSRTEIHCNLEISEAGEISLNLTQSQTLKTGSNSWDEAHNVIDHPIYIFSDKREQI